MEQNFKYDVGVTRAVLRARYPMLGVLAFSLAPYPCESIAQIKVAPNGACAINPDWFSTLDGRERLWLLSVVSLHLGLRFFERIGGRDVALANLAHDLVVNLMAQDAGLKAIEGAPVSEDFRNLSFEEVYERLMNDCESPEVQQVMAQAAGNPTGIDCEPDMVQSLMDGARAAGVAPMEQLPEGREQIRRKWADAWHQACAADRASASPMRGNMPAGEAAQVDRVIAPPPNFLAQLANSMGCGGREGRATYVRPHAWNRYGSGAVIRPGLVGQEGSLHFLIDTSGSMFWDKHEVLLGQALDTVFRLAAAMKRPVKLWSCDAAVQEELDKPALLSRLRDSKVQVRGMGGSDFCPAFAAIQQETRRMGEKSVVVAFTDGDISVPDHPGRNMTTVWVTDADGKAPAPWGKHCPMQGDAAK